jgi:hypothetical protein
MDIFVQGSRSSAADWVAARGIPREQLPPLTAEQKEVANGLGIPEEDYARSALAGQRGSAKLLAKTERFARVVAKRARAKGAEVDQVTLNAFDGRFEVEGKAGETPLFIRVDEGIVDELFESGSVEADQRLSRVLDGALDSLVHG